MVEGHELDERGGGGGGTIRVGILGFLLRLFVQ